jgi:Ferritin-like domain
MSTHGSGRSALAKIGRDPVSRRRFLALGGASGGAGMLLAACGSDGDSSSTVATTSSVAPDQALAQFGKGDLGIVNYALTLEYLESAFYADVVRSGLFKGQDLALIKSIGSNEDQHVQALEGTAKKLGAKPAPKPKAQFPIQSADQVLKLAATVENLGAAAYLGQAGAIESPDILAAALAIHSVEGRHASALNTLTGQPFTPDGAFAAPQTASEVLDQVKPFIAA